MLSLFDQSIIPPANRIDGGARVICVALKRTRSALRDLYFQQAAANETTQKSEGPKKYTAGFRN